jgi:hypothetical protein
MTDPVLLVIVIFLTVAAIAGLVIYLLSPAREKFLSDEPAVNDSRISSQWTGGLDAPSQHGGIDGGGHSGL